MFSNTLVTGGIFNHVVNNVTKGGFERLQDAVAHGAFHNSGDRFDPPKCHPNTRLAVLKKIMDWILRQDPDTRDALIIWIYGPAGAGKSAIAQTLAEMCHAENKLLASFFFLRNDPLRGAAQRLIATLAYQLALKLPQQVREHIILAIDHDPLIFTLSLEAQLTALIVQPVKQLAESGFFDDPQSPRLIIIDGLDECENSGVQCKILRVLFQSLQRQSLPLLFLIASRPETDISASFNSLSATSILARLGLDDSYLPDDDIRLFLNDKFEEVKRTHKLKNHIPPSWPTEDILERLVRKSSGQFIYACTVVKFVGSSRHRPTGRLEIILGIRPASGEAPFAELDALYTHIFSTVDDIGSVQRIIGLLILQPPLQPFSYIEDLEAFLFLKPGDLSLILSDLGSLISLKEEFGINFPHVLHASLKDFFLDASRSKDLYINVVERHTEYARLCFQHLKNHSLNRAILNRLFYHSSYALVTPELRENILQLSVKSLLALICPWHFGFAQWISIFMSFLDSLTWDPDKIIFRDQLESLDQFFMHHLDTYYSNPFLLLVVTVFPRYNAFHRDYPSFPRASRAIDNDRLHLYASLLSLEPWPKYGEFFTSFIEDPMRAGKYFLDSAKYSSAALVALIYICNYWSHPLPAVHSDPDRHIRRNAPRRWREKRGRNSVFFSVRMNHKPCPGTDQYKYMHPYPYGPPGDLDLKPQIYFNVRKNPWKKDRHAHGVFCFALDNLPYVLKRAEKSPELFDFARQAQFGRRAKRYPKSTRLAQKAIEEYLARFSDEM